MAGWIKMPLGMEVGLGPGDCVLDGDPAPPPQKKGHSPHQIFGRRLTAEWIKMPLGTEIGLGLGDVLDGDPCSSPVKGAQHPSFLPMSTVAKRLDG